MALVAYSAPIFSEGSSAKVALYRLKGVTNGDTFVVSTDFSRAIVATTIDSTRSLGLLTSSAITSNTTITFVLTNLALDDLYLLVYGSAA